MSIPNIEHWEKYYDMSATDKEAEHKKDIERQEAIDLKMKWLWDNDEQDRF